MPNVVGPKPSPPPPVNPQFAMTSPRPVTTPSPRPPRHRQPGENLSQLVFGDSRQHHLEYLQDTSCCVMYLTLEGDGSSDTESVRVSRLCIVLVTVKSSKTLILIKRYFC